MTMRREKLATGIYRDQYGISVIASVGTRPRLMVSPQLRFPLTAIDWTTDKTYAASLAKLEAVWHREKMKLKEALAKAGGPIVRGTLAADIVRYFATARLTKRLRQEREQQLKWWSVTMGFGSRDRASLKPDELQQAINSLHGLSESTRNKYRTALSNLFTVLGGKNAPNPFRDVPKEEEPEAVRRDQPYELIQVVLAKLRDRGASKTAASRTKAWLRVLAYSPITIAQLERARRSDVNYASAEFSMTGRHKGGGTRGKGKPLSPEALDAFRAFEAAGCWGTDGRIRKPLPSRSSRLRTFKAAVKVAVAELRKTRPDLDLSRAGEFLVKDLRHSYLTVVLRETGNLDLTAEMADHKHKSTTLRYAQGAVAPLLREAGAKVAAAFAKIPPYVPPPVDLQTKLADSHREHLREPAISGKNLRVRAGARKGAKSARAARKIAI